VLNRQERTVLIGLLLFALFFRLATLMMIHTGVDERDYWFSAKAIAHGLPYPELSHRTTRWTVILPVAAAQVILGSHPDVYYVLPILNSLAQVTLAFLLGIRLRGRLTGFLAGLGLALFPYMIRAGSQVRPEIFSITYMLIVFFCFVTYLERTENDVRSLLWTAGWLFVAYEAKVTNLFFLPGLLLIIALQKRKLTHVLLFGGVLFLLFLLETGAYAVFTPYKLGQLEIIATHHLESASPLIVHRFVDLFQRYSTANLQIYWQVPFALFAVAAAYFLIKGKDARLSALIVATLFFFAGVTFEVAGLNPIRPAESFINRYFCAVLGPVFLVLGCAAEAIVRRLRKEDESTVPYLGFLAFCAAAVLAIFSLPRLPAGIRMYANSPLHLRQHPLVLNETYRRQINTAYAEGMPIVSAGDGGGDNALQTCESYFIDSSFYKVGRPPQYVRTRYAGVDYLVLAPEGGGITTESVLAAVRFPFRVVPLPVRSIHLMTSDSVDGTKGSTNNDVDQ